MKYCDYSVLMCVYAKDSSIFLKEAIESILTQTKRTNDFIIVEDGILPYELEKIILNYEEMYSEISVIRNKNNKGLGECLSQGLIECKNEIVARMDADDISNIDRMRKELQLINSSGVDFVGTNIIEFDEYNNQYEKKMPEYNDDIIKYAKFRNPINHPTVMFKKSKVLKIGNYRNIYRSEDYDLWLRMLYDGSIGYNIQENLVYMRTNSNFYKRRGGFRNLIAHYKIIEDAYKRKQISKFEFMNNMFLTFLKVIASKRVKEFIYRKILRKKKK